MKTLQTTLTAPILRREVLKISIESKKSRVTKVLVELGTKTPNGTIRWTSYNKLKKQLSAFERKSIESQIVRLSLEAK